MRGAKNVAGRQQRKIDIVHTMFLAKTQNVLAPATGHARMQESGCAWRNDDLIMRRDVVAVRMGNEGETFAIPRIEPKVILRQVNTALVTNIYHVANLRSNHSSAKRSSGADLD